MSTTPHTHARAYATLAEDYGKLLEETALADVTLEVDGERFLAYRAVLAVRSAYFKANFTSAMRCSVAGQDIKI
jgi:ribosomal protein S6